MDNNELTRNNDVLTFLHIPKTGGKTLESCIFEQCSNKDINSDKAKGFYSGVFYYPYGFWSKNFSILKDADKEILQRDDLVATLGHFRFGIHEYMSRAANYLTLVRNPVDRIISLYNHVKISNPGKFHGSFIDSMIAQDIVEFSNDQTRRIAGFAIDKKFENGAEMLDAAKANIKKNFALVGTTDRFDDFLVLLGMKYGWDTIPNYLPRHVNLSKSKLEVLDYETTEAINSYNELDSKLYEFIDHVLDSHITQAGSRYRVKLAEYRSSQKNFLKQYPKSYWPDHFA